MDLRQGGIPQSVTVLLQVVTPRCFIYYYYYYLSEENKNGII